MASASLRKNPTNVQDEVQSIPSQTNATIRDVRTAIEVQIERGRFNKPTSLSECLSRLCFCMEISESLTRDTENLGDRTRGRHRESRTTHRQSPGLRTRALP